MGRFSTTGLKLALALRQTVGLGSLLSLTLVIAACAERITSADPNISAIDGKQLNANRMAALREVGQGCLFSLREAEGGQRMLAVKRVDLPFMLPEIRQSAETGRRDGRPVTFRIPAGAADTLVVGCWVPSTMTAAELSRLILDAATQRTWDAMYRQVLRRPVVPAAVLSAGLSREGLQFRYEWLDPFRKNIDASPPSKAASKNTISGDCEFVVPTVERKSKGPSRSVTVYTTCVCTSAKIITNAIEGLPGPNSQVYIVYYCEVDYDIFFSFDFGEEPEGTSDWEWGPEFDSLNGSSSGPTHYSNLWLSPFDPYPTDGFYVGEQYTFSLQAGHPPSLQWDYNGRIHPECAGAETCKVTLVENGEVQVTAQEGMTQSANIIMIEMESEHTLELSNPDCSPNSPDRARKHVQVWCDAPQPSTTQRAALDSAVVRLRAKGGECALVANRMEAILGNSRVKIPSVKSGFFGIASFNTSETASWIALAEEVFHFRAGNPGPDGRTLDGEITHEIDHTFGHDHVDGTTHATPNWNTCK